LKRVDVHALAEQQRQEMRSSTSEAKRKKVAKRLKVVEAFRGSGNRPEWMMLTVIPVLPRICARSCRSMAAVSRTSGLERPLTAA
jgi:DNA-directed RNA polymerase beta' subunit